MSRHNDIREVLRLAYEKSVAYLDGLESRPVAPSPEAIRNLLCLDIPLPENPSDPKEALELLDKYGTPATASTAGSRFFGFVIGGSLPAALAADWLTSAWDQNTGLYHVTPATAHVEAVALRWLLDLLHLPPDTAGAFVTGTTVANFVALVAARNAVLQRVGWDVREQGLQGAPPITVYLGQEAHPVVYKDLALLGIGTKQVVEIDVDAQGRMRAESLPRPIGPTIVIAQVGNVNTGSCDPMNVICDRVAGTNAWVHVDGAFGLWAATAPDRRHLVAGVERADSWATDAHKWLNVPYDSGIAFVKDREVLRRAMAVTAAYLPTETEFRNPSDYTPELSRRARGVSLWAALYSLGRTGVADLIERTCRYAEMFANGLRRHGFEVLNDVVLNQVLVSFGSREMTERVTAALCEEGTAWCGTTEWQGQFAMRISISSWATTEEDVEKSLVAMMRAAERARAEAKAQ